MSTEDADYAIKIINKIKHYWKPIQAEKALAINKNQGVGANIFVGNLDPEIEQLPLDTFSAFGVILQTSEVMMGPGTGRVYVSAHFAPLDASEAASEAVDGQYLCNRSIVVFTLS